jgi:hypothetical protein
VVAHVKALSLFLLDGVVDKAGGGVVVQDDWNGRLWVAHLMEGGSDGNGFFTVDEGGADFSVGHVFADVCWVEDGAVVDFEFGRAIG